jgi:hypothetical protein
MGVIGVDIDSTLYDFEQLARNEFLKHAREQGDKSVQRGAYITWTEWRSPTDACGLDVWLEVIDRCHADESILAQQPFDGAKDVLWELYLAGNDLRFISTRDTRCTEATQTWLTACGFPEGELICTMDNKIPHLRDVQYLIDDRPKTIVEFIYDFDWKNRYGSTNADKQRKAFALAFPYNINLTDVPNLYLAPTWYGIHNYLIDKGVLKEAEYALAS